jgi:3-methylcrotonyl-CoA carboxylase alpha subunit/geranyl-CoA carboxylase alpha subunit
MLLEAALAAVFPAAGRHKALPPPFARPLRIRHRGELHSFDIREQSDGSLQVQRGGEAKSITPRCSAKAQLDSGVWHVQCGPIDLQIENASFEPADRGTGAATANELRAPFNGKVIAVHAKPGAAVSRGETLLVLESMKLEHALAAVRDGTIKAVHVSPGQQAATAQLLVTFEESAPPAAARQSRP